jgi:hypothetical protein
MMFCAICTKHHEDLLMALANVSPKRLSPSLHTGKQGKNVMHNIQEVVVLSIEGMCFSYHFVFEVV